MVAIKNPQIRIRFYMYKKGLGFHFQVLRIVQALIIYFNINWFVKQITACDIEVDMLFTLVIVVLVYCTEVDQVDGRIYTKCIRHLNVHCDYKQLIQTCFYAYERCVIVYLATHIANIYYGFCLAWFQVLESEDWRKRSKQELVVRWQTIRLILPTRPRPLPISVQDEGHRHLKTLLLSSVYYHVDSTILLMKNNLN